MKKKAFLGLAIVAIASSIFYGVLLHPAKVNLVLLAEVFSEEGNIPIIVGPIFWTQQRSASYGTLGYDDEVVTFLNDYDFSEGYLVVS